MTNDVFELDGLERDALTELVNIGVSRAASSLRKMLDRLILLTVPSVELVSRKAAAILLGQQEVESLLAIEQQFDGPFDGRALLVFPNTHGRSLVRAILWDDISEAELQTIEDEAMGEAGNIILNSCLGSMANMLNRTLRISLPKIVRGESPRLFIETEVKSNDLVLFLYINFTVSERDIRGYLALVMDVTSLGKLKALITEFIERVTNGFETAT